MAKKSSGANPDPVGTRSTASPFFKRSRKVMVALTVEEILDEQIARKLVYTDCV